MTRSSGRVRLALGILVLVLISLEPAGPRTCRAHNLGAGIVGHKLDVTLREGTIRLEYVIEIPATAWIREYVSDPRRPHPGVPGAEQEFSGLVMATLQRGLILLWNGQQVPMVRMQALQEMSGLADYNFFQYRLSLEGSFPEGEAGTFVLINRNYAGFQNAYSVSLWISPAYRLQDTNLKEPGQRFVLDTQTGMPWSLWEGLRSLRIQVRPAPAWRSLLGGEAEPVQMDLADVLGQPEAARTRADRRGGLRDDAPGAAVTARLKRLLLQEDPDAWLPALALALAFFLGAVHALGPGHGKALVGAYLVGTRGRPVDAVTLGLVVTASHVSSVLILGVISLAASRAFVPEKTYPYIEMASALLLMGLGGWMLKTRWPHPSAHDEAGPSGGATRAHTHHHTHGHPHGHPHPHGHAHPHPHHHTHPPMGTSATERRDVRWKELLSLGISGGMVPCPSALAILLIAIALGKITFGILVLVSFSLGLASVLVALGLLLVWARPLLGPAARQDGRWAVWLPVASSLLVFLVGVFLFSRALLSGGTPV